MRSLPAAANSALRFDHGVASGDPLDDGFMLWTRVSGMADGSLPVRWLVANDPDLTQVVREGIAWTDGWSDYTVKVDVRGLPSGSTYYYRFEIDEVESVVGRTRTLPEGTVDRAQFAVVSCSNHPAGYFNVYRDIALTDDLDAVIHLGDYIYEYGLGQYATEHAEKLGRVPEPAGEVKTLADYRQRHAQYKADPDSVAMHQRHPLIAVWDDHEIANDAWREGAENHQDDEGGWQDRRDAAIRAWFEWMPVRGVPKGADTRIFRRFRYGELLSLIMLDTGAAHARAWPGGMVATNADRRCGYDVAVYWTTGHAGAGSRAGTRAIARSRTSVDVAPRATGSLRSPERGQSADGARYVERLPARTGGLAQGPAGTRTQPGSVERRSAHIDG
jgi:alkaline phosphatase D